MQVAASCVEPSIWTICHRRHTSWDLPVVGRHVAAVPAFHERCALAGPVQRGHSLATSPLRCRCCSAAWGATRCTTCLTRAPGRPPTMAVAASSRWQWRGWLRTPRRRQGSGKCRRLTGTGQLGAQAHRGRGSVMCCVTSDSPAHTQRAQFPELRARRELALATSGTGRGGLPTRASRAVLPSRASPAWPKTKVSSRAATAWGCVAINGQAGVSLVLQ